MLASLTALIVCQCLGEVLARAAAVPLPGPVLGLLILLGWLIAKGGPGPELRNTANGLLRHLSLLFVPAGVGVITQLDALAQDWRAILVSILVSTALGVAVTGLVMQRLDK